MDLVDHLTVRRNAPPVAVLPAVSRGIDEDGPAVGPGNLSPGRGVCERRTAVEAECIASAGLDSGHDGPRTSRRPRERARSRVRRSGPVRPIPPVQPRPGSWRRRRRLPRHGRTGASMGRAMSPRTLPGDVEMRYGPSHRTSSNPMRRRAFPSGKERRRHETVAPGRLRGESQPYDFLFSPPANDAQGHLSDPVRAVVRLQSRPPVWLPISQPWGSATSTRHRSSPRGPAAVTVTTSSIRPG